MKFSIIVPVYNVEDYLDKCLNSIKEQTYKNFEVIIVNDESPDNSQKIIDKYTKKDQRFKCYNKKNGGVSSARNHGLKYVKGDYLIFIDGDDYIDKYLLEKLNKELEKQNYDMIRFSYSKVDESGNIIKEINIKEENNDKNSVIKEILNNELVDVMWLYTYNIDFFKKNKFTFTEGRIHEDYGLILLILSKAKTMKIINYQGYYYVQRENSIMNSITYDKLKRRVDDFYYFYLIHKKELKDNYIDKLLLSFSASCMIVKCNELNDKDLDEYLKLLKKNKTINDIYGNTLKRKLKKIYLRLNLKKYIISLRSEN